MKINNDPTDKISASRLIIKQKFREKGRREAHYRQTVLKPRRALSLMFSINIPRVRATGYFYVTGDGIGQGRAGVRGGNGEDETTRPTQRRWIEIGKDKVRGSENRTVQKRKVNLSAHDRCATVTALHMIYLTRDTVTRTGQ